jgi:hypothetical protein
MEIEKRKKSVKKDLMFMSLFLVGGSCASSGPIQCPY